ncbi:hypothetical protein FHL15_007367 [Xylaria flabelliformis]|uniref:Uncharacterized protein n=1 Tax=Xylaria flabelliformis TaxID=2512241 RepID=A0A553HV41_9PEZI|nr:hypothetical protein FHL15_007367 [Xylaria flabelliformis]
MYDTTLQRVSRQNSIDAPMLLQDPIQPRDGNLLSYHLDSTSNTYLLVLMQSKKRSGGLAEPLLRASGANHAIWEPQKPPHW